MDGSDRIVILERNSSLQSLTMDFDSQRLYYVYDNSGIAYYDIKNKTFNEALVASDVTSVSSVTIYNGSMYFSENIQSSIMHCEKNTCQDLNIVRKNTSKISP